MVFDARALNCRMIFPNVSLGFFISIHSVGA